MESAVLKIGSDGADWEQGNRARQKKRPQRGADALRPLQSDARQVTWGVDLSVPPPGDGNAVDARAAWLAVSVDVRRCAAPRVRLEP